MRSTQSRLVELLRAWSPLGRGWLSCGRRSTQSRLAELLRAWWSPLGRGWLPCRRTQSLLAELLRAWLLLGCGWLSFGKASRRSCCARGSVVGRGWLPWQAQYTEPPGSVVVGGPRLAVVWQAQYTEPFGGAAARVVAAGPRLAAV